MTQDVYLTGSGAYMPGAPLDNDEIVHRLGATTDGRGAKVRHRVLAANGIKTRHYALDESGLPTMLNDELAAKAVSAALKDRGIETQAVGMLAAATTQGDLLVPGFGSMVHGRIAGGPMEVLTAGGVCASSIAALANAARSVRLGEHDVAVAVGSELVGRSLRQSRYGENPSFDAEFLRWTLSDGAGAVVLESAPRPNGSSLRIDWTHTISYAHEQAPCMVAGASSRTTPLAGETWLALCLMNIPFALCLTRDEYRRAVHSMRLDESLLSLLATITGDPTFHAWRPRGTMVRVDSWMDVPRAVYEHAVVCEHAHARLRTIAASRCTSRVPELRV